MSNEVSVNLMCVQMRSGVEVWLEAEKAKALQVMLTSQTSHRFINYEGQSFNTADLVGVFTAATMEATTHRKNGQWQCNFGKWHGRGEDCSCSPAVDWGGIGEKE
jgi:hypothetical protein